MERRRFFCIDAHTCGNPVRLVAGGMPFIPGGNISEIRLNFLKHYDWIRKSLMFEPKGHDMMSGSILFPPFNPQNDFAILFIETSGCLPMCGHGTIGTVTIAIEEGLIHPKVPGFLNIETPAGLIKVTYTTENNKVKEVKITNIASFLYISGLEITSDYLGKLNVDISYGGNFYAIIDPQENYEGLHQYTAEQLIVFSRDIRTKVNKSVEVVHPENPNILGCSHILWTGNTINASSTARNAVFYGDKAIDRSPCGTGTSARMAQWYALGKLLPGEHFIHESFIGSVFVGTIEGEVKVGDYKAIIPSISGWAKVFGYNNILVDPEDDPFAGGFQVI